MGVSLIVAMDAERGIGKNNDLMWHLPADMKFFKDTTVQHIVVMGRKNWDSIPDKFRPLINRQNAVLSRNKNLKLDGALVFESLQSCLANFKEDARTIFIIGGGEIYKLALELNAVDEMYITQVDDVFGADTFFPDIDFSKWSQQVVGVQPKDDRHVASFTIYKYIKK